MGNGLKAQGSRLTTPVIPAKAGIQRFFLYSIFLDSGLHRSDEYGYRLPPFILSFEIRYYLLIVPFLIWESTNAVIDPTL